MRRDDAGNDTEPSPDTSGRLLMLAVARGDVDAFEALYDSHSASVCGLALQMLRNAQDAEEATADVFLSAWHNAASFDVTQGSLLNWLLTITRRRAIDRIRTIGVRARAAASLEQGQRRMDPGDPVAEEVHMEARAQDVASVLASLPDLQRRVLSLSIVGGYSHAEIALMLGLPLGTVKSRVRLALGHLRGTLTRGGPPAALLSEVLAAA